MICVFWGLSARRGGDEGEIGIVMHDSMCLGCD